MEPAAVQQPVVTVQATEGLPVAAIVVLAVVGYLIIFTVLLVVRQCLIAKTGSFCPSWCTESCQCCDPADTEPGCLAKCALACNYDLPNKQRCLDMCCPSKQSCDEKLCCCMSQEPGGECCNCGDCNNPANSCCGPTGACGSCGEFGDCCSDCSCKCCSQPDTINCCCIEVKLSGSSQPNQMNQSMNQAAGQGGYAGQPGGMMMMSQPGMQHGMMGQPGMMGQSGMMMGGGGAGGMMGQPGMMGQSRMQQGSMMGQHGGGFAVQQQQPGMMSQPGASRGGMFSASGNPVG